MTVVKFIFIGTVILGCSLLNSCVVEETISNDIPDEETVQRQTRIDSVQKIQIIERPIQRKLTEPDTTKRRGTKYG
ncbi:MAG: hypothetical protein P8H56_11460, partial [Crocinitomicaceae bacterium]|nr:hypothetical protein [Crocinitomicaceae bacterium]